MFPDPRNPRLGLPGAHHWERGLYRAGVLRVAGDQDRVSLPYFPNHRGLLTPLEEVQPSQVSGDDRPGAVVIPTGRPGTATRSGIPFAARLALRHGCPLVVLVSGDAAEPAAVAALERQITVPTPEGPVRPDTLVLTVAPQPTKMTTFGVDKLDLSRMYRWRDDASGGQPPRTNDVGRKRNLALLLAAGMNWRSVLLLDDDMFADVDGLGGERQRHSRTLDDASLPAAVRALSQGHLAVGWTARAFDDNSVVCRIAGLTGTQQDQFLGAGALLVPVHPRMPFFPSIYNHDWLFLLSSLRRRSDETARLLDGGDIHQDPYPAFRPERAASEELGDIQGEGLMSLMQVERFDEAYSATFWRHALAHRREFRDTLESRVSSGGYPRAAEMLKALAAVKRVHDHIAADEPYWVAQFISFMKWWSKDLQTWERRLHPDDLPAPGRLLRSKEFHAAHTLGASQEPEDFVRRFRGSAPADARVAAPVTV